MKSKISCFNKTIFKKNLTLYWPLWTAFLLYMLASIPVSLYQYMQGFFVNPGTKQFSALRNVFHYSSEPIIIFLFCVAAVMAVFSYLYTAKNANGIHGLPVTRLELFVTNTVSAFLALALAELIAFIAGVFVGISCGVTRIDILLYTFLMQLGMTFFGVAFSTCIAMLTGHLMALPVYCIVANYLYVLIRYVAENLILGLTYGLSDLWRIDKSYVLSPLYYLTEAVFASLEYEMTEGRPVIGVTIEGGGVVAGYAVVGIGLFVVAYRLYRKRQLETAGDIIAVSFMKPVFRFGVGICGGTTLGLFLADLFYFETERYSDGRFFIKLFFVVACNLIGFLAAEMLMQKNFRIFTKKIVLQAGVSVAAMILFMGSVHMDAFGLEGQIPKKEEIVKAFIDLDYPVKYDGESIDEILALHQQILDEKEQTLDAMAVGTESYTASIRYLLADGTVFARDYAVLVGKDYYNNPNAVSGKIIAKECETERFTKYVLGINYEKNMYLTGSISLYDKYQNHMEYRLSEEEIAILVDALKTDIADGNYEKYLLYSIRRNDESEDEFLNNMTLNYYNEQAIVHEEEEYWEIQNLYSSYYQDFNGGMGYGVVTENAVAQTTVVFDSKFDTDSLYMSFGKKCTNLVNALEELGIVNDIWHLYTYEEYDKLRTEEK